MSARRHSPVGEIEYRRLAARHELILRRIAFLQRERKELVEKMNVLGKDLGLIYGGLRSLAELLTRRDEC